MTTISEVKGGKAPSSSGHDSDDIEKGTTQEITVSPENDTFEPKLGFWERLSGAGVETRGAEPVPEEKRTDTRYINVLTVFATSMTSLLP